MKGKKMATDGLFTLMGAVIYSIGTHCFIVPADIAPGGAVGIALMANHISGAPIGTLTLMVNLPLLLLAAAFLSRKFALKTAVTCAVASFVLDVLVTPALPYYTGDRLLCSLYGGLLVGVGMACIFLGGSTTGGSDIVGYLLQKKQPHVSIGRALMIIDGVVLSFSILVFENVDAALFGLISLYAQNKVIDSILYGCDVGSKATIVTAHPKEIVDDIITKLDRSATIVRGEGGYSQKETSIVLCAVRKSEFSKLKRIVHEADPDAFVMVTETIEVFGLGFKDFVPRI